MYDENEVPTRPDWPKTVARVCKHCGKVYGEHAQTAQPQTLAKCQGIRHGFDPEDACPGDTR
jgi:hypothetical protein